MHAVKPENGMHGRVGRIARKDAARVASQEGDLIDGELEKRFLGECMQSPSLIISSQVAVTDFYSEHHAAIFQVMLELAADGVAVDTWAVRTKLHERGNLEQVGGQDYLVNALESALPGATFPERLRMLARQRQVRAAARAVAAYAGTDDLQRALERLRSAEADLAAVERGTRSRVPPLPEAIRNIGHIGPRLQLGLPKLDEATRGGVPLGRVVAVLGAPGSSKTNFVTWLSDHWERDGFHVAFVAADEGRDSILIRLAQLDGYPRESIEELDGGRREHFAMAAGVRHFTVIDPFDDHVSLEQAEQILIDDSQGRARVLVVDSVQTAPCEAADQYETTREQIEAKMRVLEGIARRGTLVVFISEMTRAAYRTGKRDQDISALAGAAESRKIEYASHLVLGLRSVKGESGLIDVEVAKNRLGKDKPDLRATLDFNTLRWSETDRPMDEDVQKEIARSNAIRDRVLAGVKLKECKTHTAIAAAAQTRKRDALPVIRDLEAEGILSLVGGVFRVGNPTPAQVQP